MKLPSITVLSILMLASFCAAGQNNKDSAEVDDRVFTKVEEEASYPGGNEGWRKFLEKNLNADVPLKNNAPAGLYPVIARFIVGRDGNISDVRTESIVGYGMDEEVIRVIKKSGKWVPAIQNGRPVNAYRRQPVTFLVEPADFDLRTASPYIFFTGTENELTVSADKVKPGNIDVTISKGSIKQIAEGKYIIKVDTPGRVIVEVFNTKKNKSLGTASFEVKEK
jgi:Gram-negative bacterial TonB protein C-terminal/GldM C-terminal domain